MAQHVGGLCIFKGLEVEILKYNYIMIVIKNLSKCASVSATAIKGKGAT